MRFKKIGCLLAPLALAILCACGQSAQDSSAAGGAETGQEPTRAVMISEAMAANKSALRGGHGDFPDWVELYNPGTEAVQLAGYTLSDGEHDYELPEQELKGGEYFVILCAKGSEYAGYASFGLSSKGETLTLTDADGNAVDEASFGESGADESYIRAEDLSMEPCSMPTPGYENTEAGYEAAQESIETPALAINEVMVFNRVYDRDGEYYDIIELKNNSDEAIDLSQYYLSDSFNVLMAYQLPAETLAPGGLYVVYCDASVPFALDSERDQLYLSYEDGTLTDAVPLHGIPTGGSMGRLAGENGFFYFNSPSVGAENSGGARFISEAPVAAESDGVFEDVSRVKAELTAKGTIYYTLDGSMPDESSEVYTGPLYFDSTTVLRAVSVEDGKLPSASLDLSYIINEGHTLPVTSLIVDPEDFTGKQGIYSNPSEDWERPASVALFDGDEGFKIACGVKIHGATSRVAQEKKSYKLCFRGAYGGELNYDLFENGVTEFSSILLRAAQESSFSTNIRDIAMHVLASQCEPTLSTQDYKYSILYINGEYWGIYALREAHSEEHFARHHGYDESQVTMWKGRWASDSEFEQVYRFITSNDMRDSENYRKAAEYIDLDSLVAWSIIESYSGNLDINSLNVRFYYTEEDHKLHIALVDLDLGLFSQGWFFLTVTNEYDFNILLRALLENEEFQQLMLEKAGEYLAGPLSEENATAVIDSLAAELRPEIERDGERWGYTLSQWERHLENYVYGAIQGYGNGGYCLQFARSARDYIKISSEDFERYFGNLEK